MQQFRCKAKQIVRQVVRGQRMVLTYRGKPVVRLEPFRNIVPAKDDPFYKLADLAVDEGTDVTNEEIDRVVYDI